MKVYYDTHAIEHEKSQETLAKFKRIEKEKKRYTWTGHNLTVSHTDKTRLHDIVVALGYDWSEGCVGHQN